jgi:hypothetical protein
MSAPYRPVTEVLTAKREERPAPLSKDRRGRALRGPCLVWTGGVGGNGYATVRNRRDFGTTVPQLVHRVAYALDHGVPLAEIGTIGEIDHLCRVLLCSAPAHLEEVSHRENLARGNHHWTGRDRCRNGHRYSPENTGHPSSGGRQCLTCKRTRGRNWARGHRAAT